MKERYRWDFPKSIDNGKGIDETAKSIAAMFAKLFKGNCQNINVVFNPKSLKYEMYVTIDKGDNENGNK
nr:MAG TPA: hypothetical protein [Bacteriophage sp.]